MSNYADTMDAVKWRSVYGLAADADCAGPDGLESEGAQFLAGVRGATVEAVEWVMSKRNAESGPITVDEFESITDEISHEVADGAPSVYTSTLWAQFVDLAAYNEDEVRELAGEDADMGQQAGVALYLIARRLVDSILGELRDAIEEDEEETEEG